MTIDLRDVGSGYKRTSINANFQDIETEINNNLLSKNGGVGLEADLDANSQKIINLDDGVLNQDAVTVRQLSGAIAAAGSGLIASQKEVQTGADVVGNVTTFTGITYTVGGNNLFVFRNGNFQTVGIDYTETSSSSITWLSTPNSTDGLTFITNLATTNSTTDTSAITHAQSGTNYNLASYLQNRNAIHVKDYGVVADGVTQDTSAFRTVIAEIETWTQGGVVEFPPNGIIYIDEFIKDGNGVQLLRISNVPNLVIKGNGCKFLFNGKFNRDSVDDRPLFLQFFECDNLYIENLTAEGQVDQMTKGAVTEPTAHGFFIAGCKGSTLVNCHSEKHPGDGIYYGVSGGSPLRNCSNAVQINCSAKDNARNNLTINECNGFLGINSDFRDAGLNLGTYGSGHSPQAGVDIEPLVSGASVDEPTGNILFINLKSENNVGSAFVATDNGHLEGKVTLIDPVITNAQGYSFPLYMGGPQDRISGGDIDVGSGELRMTSGMTVLKDVQKLKGSSLALTAVGADTEFDIQDNVFESTATSALSTYAINFDGGASSEKRVFKGNKITVPDAAHDGTAGGDAACRFKDTQCEDNKYFTDLTVATSEHFYNEYVGSSINASSKDEDYRSVSNDAYRPASGSTWNLSNLYGRGKAGFEQLTLAAGNNSRSTMLLSGSGAPSGDPGADRAIYIRYDGAASTALYFWNGSTWAAIA